MAVDTSLLDKPEPYGPFQADHVGQTLSGNPPPSPVESLSSLEKRRSFPQIFQILLDRCRSLRLLLKELAVKCQAVLARSKAGSAILAQLRRFPRTAGILAGVIILGGVLLFWRKPSEPKESTAANDTQEWKLEDVQVFPPSNPIPNDDGTKTPNVLPNTDGSEGPLLLGGNGERLQNERLLPDTPRAVWLTGVIEEIPTESDVQRIGHVELPMERHHRSADRAPNFPAYRRR